MGWMRPPDGIAVRQMMLASLRGASIKEVLHANEQSSYRAFNFGLRSWRLRWSRISRHAIVHDGRRFRMVSITTHLMS